MFIVNQHRYNKKMLKTNAINQLYYRAESSYSIGAFNLFFGNHHIILYDNNT